MNQLAILNKILERTKGFSADLKADTTFEELKMDDYKLTGYTLDDIETIEEFDSTFKKSKYIKGMQVTDKGFSKFSKVLSCNDFDTLYSIAENKINSVIDSINNNDFTINPKIKEDNSNASCP